jgi:hypothetical protein
MEYSGLFGTFPNLSVPYALSGLMALEQMCFVGRSTSVCSPARTGQNSQGPTQGPTQGAQVGATPETGGGRGPAPNKRQRPSRPSYFFLTKNLVHFFGTEMH